MKENIVIIGGGIAGLEVAVQLLDLGYKPIVIEKRDRLGGHVADWNLLFPDMIPARDVVGNLIARASEANIFLNTEISFVNKLKDSYNIMLSNGISINTRIIVMTTGFALFDAAKKEEYGYGVYDQVMTNKDLEHWFNTGDDKRCERQRDECRRLCTLRRVERREGKESAVLQGLLHNGNQAGHRVEAEIP